jgi:DNA-binding transcriptional LysR family regulator
LQRSGAGQWIAQNVARGDIAISADSFMSLASLAASAGKRAILPVVSGDAHPGLERLETVCEVPPVPIWVACHVDLEKSGRLSKARAIIAAALKDEMNRLQG